jgi:hypothetical protein
MSARHIPMSEHYSMEENHSRIHSALLADFADLPDDEREPYEGSAHCENRLGKRSCAADAHRDRDKSALWGMASDSQPVDPRALQHRLQLQYPDGVPGFTTLADGLRAKLCASAFVRDAHTIPKDRI